MWISCSFVRLYNHVFRFSLQSYPIVLANESPLTRWTYVQDWNWWGIHYAAQPAPNSCCLPLYITNIRKIFRYTSNGRSCACTGVFQICWVFEVLRDFLCHLDSMGLKVIRSSCAGLTLLCKAESGVIAEEGASVEDASLCSSSANN